MAGKSTIDEATRREILELARQGLGCRSIETRLAGRAKKTAIAELVAEARQGKGGLAGAAEVPESPKARKPVVAPSRAAAPPPEAPALPTGAELEAEAADALDAADRAHERLDELHEKLTARIDQELELPAPDLRTLTGVSKLMLEVAVTLARTRPPVAMRPEDDPTNLDAARQLHERLDRLVADARRKVGLDVPALIAGGT